MAAQDVSGHLSLLRQWISTDEGKGPTERLLQFPAQSCQACCHAFSCEAVPAKVAASLTRVLSELTGVSKSSWWIEGVREEGRVAGRATLGHWNWPLWSQLCRGPALAEGGHLGMVVTALPKESRLRLLLIRLAVHSHLLAPIAWSMGCNYAKLPALHNEAGFPL